MLSDRFYKLLFDAYVERNGLTMPQLSTFILKRRQKQTVIDALTGHPVCCLFGGFFKYRVGPLPQAASPDRSRTVIRDILRYLSEHPDAKDTRDGILRWWISQGTNVPEVDVVQEALDALVAKRWMFKRETMPDQVIYSMNKDHLRDIQASVEAGQ